MQRRGAILITNELLTRRAWFSGSILSRNTRLCSLCCSTCGFFAKTLRISATMFCQKEGKDVATWTKVLHINKLNTTFKINNPLTDLRKKKSYDAYWLTLILLTSKWLIARWVLIRQWLFWERFLTTLTVNLWLGIWTASRSSPLIMVGDHQPTCWRRKKKILIEHWENI